MSDYAIYSFYRNPQTPLRGRKSPTPQTAGAALTASSIDFPFDQLQDRKIKSAIWRLVWNPNARGASYTLVKLMSASSGPVYETTIARIRRNNETKPINTSADITEELSALLAAGEKKQIIQLLAGTGDRGCLIYASVIEVVWE